MGLCSLLNLFFTVSSCAQPISVNTIQTKYGEINGLDISLGRTLIKAYEGIPYAQPINSSTRFQKSEMVLPWDNVLEANTRKPTCYERLLSDGIYSEDCLYLDIYTPPEIDNSTLLPVVVYLSNELDNTGMNDNTLAFRIVPQNIILVAVQYRKGPFGFLHVPELDLPSNVGLWDSNLALLFLQDVLSAFGGDPNRITLMGQGLAATLTSAHAVSPQSSHLISQTIQMSGSIWGIGTSQIATKANSRELITSLNCPIVDDQEFLECLRNLTVEEILSETGNMTFGPIIDEEFLPAYPQILVEEAKPIPSLITVTTYGYQSRELFAASPSFFYDFNKENLIDYVRDQISPKYENEFPRAEKEIFKQYIPFKNMTSTQLLSQFVKLIEDISSFVPTARELEHRTKRSAECFLMFWDYSSPNQFPSNFSLKGSYYGQELAYLSDYFAFSPFNFSEDDLTVRRLFVDSLTHFIRTGDPSTADFKWSSYNGNQTYLKMKPNPEIDEDLFETSLSFWNHMSKFGKDIISGTNTDVENMESSASNFYCSLAFLIFLNILFFH
ncbi:unnamed protein product [Auanema sp. JU1783]|nr:unnamed protein product [Auanema sp. JU1783]